METKKINLKNIVNTLTRSEMKEIMAGSGNCLKIGEPCINNVDCCSNSCTTGGFPLLGYFCSVS